MKYFIFILLITTLSRNSYSNPGYSNMRWHHEHPPDWEPREKRKKPATRYINGMLREGFIHPNGGGFVGKDASVGDSVYVGKNAIVYGYANLSGNVRIEDHAQVYSRARLYGNVKVSGDSQVGGDVRLSDNVQVSDGILTGSASFSGNMRWPRLPTNKEVASEITEPSKERVDNFLNTVGTRSGIDANNNCQPLSE